MSKEKIFISYSHEDAVTATRIVEGLRAADLDIWIDQEQMWPGDSFLEKMNRGLADAGYLLLLVSYVSMQSQWVEREWLSTLASEDTVLVPLRLDDAPMPPLLRDIIYVDFRADVDAGLRKLVSFLKKETRPPMPPTREADGRGPLADASRKELRVVARHCLNDTEFNSMLWDLAIDPADVEGPTLQDRLLKLLHRMDAEGIIEDFLHWLETERGKCVLHQLQKLRSVGKG